MTEGGQDAAMPYSYEFVEPATCVVVTWQGKLSVDEFLVFYAELGRHEDFRPELNRLYDWRDAIIDLSTNELRTISSGIGRDDESHGPRKVAMLLHNDLDFGIMRIFSALADRLAAVLLVTRDSAKAKSWVGLMPDHMLPHDR